MGWPVKQMKRIGWTPMFWVVAMSLAAPLADAADSAWTRDVTSPGLQAAGRAVSVAFVPGPEDSRIAAGGRITRIYASRRYAGPAIVDTQLCWGSPQGPCVALRGPRVDSHAFDGRSAQGPLWLVHRVRAWGAGHPPVFIQGTVTVWFAGHGR